MSGVWVDVPCLFFPSRMGRPHAPREYENVAEKETDRCASSGARCVAPKLLDFPETHFQESQRCTGVGRSRPTR